MDVFIEPIEPAPHLYILGAGHVGFQLGQIAPTVGFRLHVVDDRQKFANHERFPAADEVVVESLDQWVTHRRNPRLVVRRGAHARPSAGLRRAPGVVEPQPSAIVGLIGSRAKVARLTDALIDAGVSADWIKQLRAPIGFDIGAVSPEEIAVAILAELIAVRRGKIDEPHVAGLSLQWAAPTLRDR